MPSLVVNHSLVFRELKGLEIPNDKPVVLSPDDEQTFVSHSDQVSRNFFLLLNGCSPNLSRKIDAANLSQLIALGKGPSVSGIAVMHGAEPCIVELKLPHQYVYTEMRSFAISVTPAGVHVLRMGLGRTLIHPEAMIDFRTPHLLPLSVKSEYWNSNVELRKLGFSPPKPAEGFLRMRIPADSEIRFYPTVGSEEIISRGIWSTVARAAALETDIVRPAVGSSASLGPAYLGQLNQNVQILLQTDTSDTYAKFMAQATFSGPFPKIDELERVIRNLSLDVVNVAGKGNISQARKAGVKATDLLTVRTCAGHLDSLVDFIKQLRALG